MLFKITYVCALFLIAVNVNAATAPHQISCQSTSVNSQLSRLSLNLEADGSYTVANENTDIYLLGLSCKFLSESPLVFNCQNPSSVSFFSQRVIQDGYNSVYEDLAKNDVTKFTLHYYYTTPTGQSKLVEKTRQYLTSECKTK